MRTLLPSLAVGAALALAACADSAPTGPIAGAPDLARREVATPGTGPWAKVVRGETGPGSMYQIFVPTSWNGDVIYFMHGLIPPTRPVALPTGTDWDSFVAVREQFGALGYAIAYSTYSENGLALKDAALRTHQLRGLVASAAQGQPDRSFIVAYSLGTAPALRLIEQFPKQYDGALLACGMVGGTPLELQYAGHVRALFDFYYPGVLPGDAVDVPEGGEMTPALQAAIVSAVLANPTGMLAIASTVQTPIAFVPPSNPLDWGNPASVGYQTAIGTMLQSLVTALGYQLYTWDVVDRTHGHSPFDNSTTTYTLGTPAIPTLAGPLSAAIAASNVGVKRYTSTPDAQNFLERYYVPTGELEIPVITVHNRWDYLVPFFHEAAFAEIVADAGSSSMLLQRTLNLYGHCSNAGFAPAVVQSFLDLAAWVDSGVKPAN
jgi:hypothetical protein